VHDEVGAVPGVGDLRLGQHLGRLGLQVDRPTGQLVHDLLLLGEVERVGRVGRIGHARENRWRRCIRRVTNGLVPVGHRTKVERRPPMAKLMNTSCHERTILGVSRSFGAAVTPAR
jgi:hypothetical protein